MARFRGFPIVGVVLGMMLAAAPSPAAAQDKPRLLVWDIARSVLIDPTTYAPVVLSYEAQRLDWRTSRVLLDHMSYLASAEHFRQAGKNRQLARANGCAR